MKMKWNGLFEEIIESREKAIETVLNLLESYRLQIIGMKRELETYKDMKEIANLEIQEVLSWKNEIVRLNAEIEKNRISILQYENLRKHFDRLVNEVLGEEYYCIAMDVYKCDEAICDDIIRKKVKVSFPTKKMKEEIFKLQARVDRLTVEIEKKDKIIDEMAKELADCKYEEWICMEVDCEHIELQNEGKCIGDKACIKEYFINKAEKESKDESN